MTEVDTRCAMVAVIGAPNAGKSTRGNALVGAKVSIVTQKLQTHPDFNWKNPNRLRALLFGLVSASPAAFHQPDGATYHFFADWIIKLDPINPQVAARCATFFETWRRYDGDRQAMIRTELSRINATPDLSGDTTEMVTRILG